MEFKDITGYIKKLRKRYDELAKGWGQIVTPLEIETSGGFKTTENAEDTENYSPSVISYETKLTTNSYELHTDSRYRSSFQFVLVRCFSLFFSIFFSCSFMNRVNSQLRGRLSLIESEKKLKKGELTC
jgi:hypothetical protein